MGKQFITKPPAKSAVDAPDSAAVFAAALSLWNACYKFESENKDANLSESYNGVDQFMRETMRIALLFETWACSHVAFEELSVAWPYFLEDRFGDACIALLHFHSMASFNDEDCLRVALHLRLPVTADGKLPIPVKVRAPNPIQGATFVAFQIQTVRDSVENDFTVPFTLDDEPFDEEFDLPYFTFYGMDEEGSLEAITSRQTYMEIVSLVRNLVTGIEFPDLPFVVGTSPEAWDQAEE
jgi:hypothetical protein